MNRKDQSIDEAPSRPWIGEHTERFRAYMIGEKMSKNTILRYLDIVEKFLLWFGKPPEKLTKWDMQRYKQEISPRYSENSMSTMVAGLNQYVEKILERVDLSIKPPKRVFKSKIPLTESEIKRILEEARKPSLTDDGRINNSDTSLRDYALICLMYWGGFRASEVANARISDLDMGNKRMRVHEGKGKDNSIVNLMDTAIQAISEYLKKGRPKPTSPNLDDFLFLSIRGNRITRRNVWEIVKTVSFKAGIEKNVHPHIFRHSMITHMAEKGLSASFIQAQSRHKSLDMVQRYTHLSQRSVRQAYDRAFEQSPCTNTQYCEETALNAPQSPNMQYDVSEVEKRKLQLYDLFIAGKITEEKLDKLLSRLEGNSSQYDPRIELI